MKQDRIVRENLQRAKAANDVYKLTMRSLEKNISGAVKTKIPSGVGLFSNETVEKYTGEER